MANSTISSLTSITTPSSSAMAWISDPNASPIDRSWSLANMLGFFLRQRVVTSGSGAIGTIANPNDSDYLLVGASTATLPTSPRAGARVTFKCLGAYGVTITANTSQTIGDGGAATTNAIGITGTGAFVALQWDVVNRIWHIVASNTSIINSASGALGTATQATDNFYEFTATGSLTLPKYPENDCVYTIKNKSSATITINANTTGVSQTIGTTTSTAFLLYAQEDYVVLHYSLADTTWYVVATNGPVLSSDQTTSFSYSGTNVWAANGVGLALALQPGKYDIELHASVKLVESAVEVFSGVAIGNGTTPISSMGGQRSDSASEWSVCPVSLSAIGYVLTAAATIQGIFYCEEPGLFTWLCHSSCIVGKITARRIG